MPPGLCATTAVLLVVGALGCSAKEESREDAPPRPTFDTLACSRPAPPELIGTPQVIGQGTAESCTTAALREALGRAGPITFACGPTPITLSVDETLVARDGTSIDGAGLVTLDGGDRVRILRTENGATVRLEGLTFQHGNAHVVDGQAGSDGTGGAILRGWQGHLYVRDCAFNGNQADASMTKGGGAIATASSGWTTIVHSTFTDNASHYGGAVYSVLSDLTVIDSRFVGNRATQSDGGAIFTDGAYVPPKAEHGTYGGLIHLCGSQFIDNVAPSSAAAGFLFAYGRDQLTINMCEFRGNKVTTADPGLGGALRIDALAFVHNSLFANNETAGQGGAVWMGRGPATFENVTFHGNRAALWGGAISYGDRPVTLDNCTVAHNFAGKGIDGLFGSEGAMHAHNTLLVSNGEAANAKRHCSVALQGDHNLIFPAESNDACGAGLLHLDPLLAAELTDLGGPTAALALGAGSPALDAGASCLTTDQRGQPRQVERCDLGAVEY